MILSPSFFVNASKRNGKIFSASNKSIGYKIQFLRIGCAECWSIDLRAKIIEAYQNTYILFCLFAFIFLL